MIPISSLLNQQENRIYPDYTIVLDGSQIQSRSPFLTSTTTVEVARLNDAENQQVKCFRRNWTRAHDQFIKDTFPHKKNKKCAKLFQKEFKVYMPVSTLRDRANYLGVVREKREKSGNIDNQPSLEWISEQDQFIRENYPHNTHIKCAGLFEKKFGLTMPISTLSDRAYTLGVTFNPKEVAEKVKKSRVINWTQDHDQFIKENYPFTQHAVCAKLFEDRFQILMPESTLRGRASVLGIASHKSGRNWNWTDEMDMFLLDNCEMCTHKEIEKLFYEKFGSRIPSRTLKPRYKKLKKLSKSVE